MAKLVLNDLTNTYNVVKINENFTRIEEELQNKVLYRNNPVGEANTLENNLDVNGNALLNVSHLYTEKITVDGLPLSDVLLQAVVDATAQAGIATVKASEASASAANSLSSFNDVRTRYYGAFTSNPVLDPIGQAVTVGDEYFNTSSNLLFRYNGSSWQSSDVNTANLAAPGGASLVGYLPAGYLSATTVQAAIDELDGEKAALTGAAFTGNIFLPTATLPTHAVTAGAIQAQTHIAYTTAGNGSTYTLTSLLGITAYVAGQSFFVTFHTMSTAAATLTINGLANPPQLVRQLGNGTYSNIAIGTIPANHRSRVTLLSPTQAWVETIPLVAIASGGTGSTTANEALIALGAPLSGRGDISSAYTVSLADKGKFLNLLAGPYTITLPAAATLGFGFGFALRNSGASGTITIDPNGADWIDSSFAVALAPGESCFVTTDGLSFNTVGLNPSIGVKQSWTDVTASRAKNTTYTNTTAAPIQLAIRWHQANSEQSILTVGGFVLEIGQQSAISGSGTHWAIVPSGVTYSLGGLNSFQGWHELR